MEAISQRNKLMAMSKGVKDCVKFIEKQIKNEQKYLLREEEDERQLGHFEDCGVFYREQVLKQKERINTMIEMKIKIEKYSKKLKHMAEECR